MINIRPHHLLCMHGFVGEGYDEQFTSNMTRIVESIQSDFNTELNIVFGLDDICMKCPNKTEDNLCSSQEKINFLDEGTTRLLGLQEDIYPYHNIVEIIRTRFTEREFSTICHKCNWYVSGYCRNGLLSLIGKEA